MLDIRLANGLHAPRHTRGHWVDQNPIGNAFRTTSSHSAPSSASSNLAQSRLWLLLFLLEIFMSETRHKTYKRERNKRHSIQQPPGKRRQANHHLTHRITYLLTHQWIPSSPSSPSTPSPRPHPRLPPPSRLLTEAPSIASSLKRPFLVDRCLISLITVSLFIHDFVILRMIRPSLSRAEVTNHSFDKWRPTAASFYWACRLN